MQDSKHKQQKEDDYDDIAQSEEVSQDMGSQFYQDLAVLWNVQIHLQTSQFLSFDKICLTQSQSMFCKQLPYDAFNLDQTNIEVNDAFSLFKKYMSRKQNKKNFWLNRLPDENQDQDQVLEKQTDQSEETDNEDFNEDSVDENKQQIKFPNHQSYLDLVTNTMSMLQGKQYNHALVTVLKGCDKYPEILEQSWKIPVHGNGVTLGSSRLNQISLKNDVKTISRFHCQISYNQDKKKFLIYDLGSTSGTFLRVNKHELKKGDIVEIGILEILIEDIQREAKFCQLKCKFLYHSNPSMIDKDVQFTLNMGETVELGKKDGCQYQFKNIKYVEDVHCRLLYTLNQVYLIDNRTDRGTWLRLSREKIQSHPMVLQDTTIVKIHPYILKIQLKKDL